MLFRTTGPIHTWFMRFPIDVLFLDRSGIVVGLRSNLQPYRLAGALRTAAVLELPAGAIAGSGTEVGDRVDIAPRSAVNGNAVR